MFEDVSDEGDYMEASQCFGASLVVLHQRATAVAQANDRSTTRLRSSRTKPRVASGNLTKCRAMPSLAAAAATVSPRSGTLVAGCVLDISGETPNCGPIADIGRGDVQRKQMTQRVDTPEGGDPTGAQGRGALGLAIATISFLLLGAALKDLPAGTAYAVWTGIGAVGGAVMGIIRGGP